MRKLAVVPVAGGCVRRIMRAFLSAPHDSVPTGDVACDAETYRALGLYARTLGEVPAARTDGLREPERRLLAAAFATVADGVTRFDPNHRFPVCRLLKGSVAEKLDSTSSLG